MCRGMKATYCGRKKAGPQKCRSFTDGKKLCMCAKAWQVFFAKVNKMGADDTKPMPKKKISEATLKRIFSESKNKDQIYWFIEATLKSSDLPSESVPKWIGLAKKVLKSPKFSPKVKAYWRKRLMSWCKKNPKYPACKGMKIRSKGEGKGKGKGPIGKPSRD